MQAAVNGDIDVVTALSNDGVDLNATIFEVNVCSSFCCKEMDAMCMSSGNHSITN